MNIYPPKYGVVGTIGMRPVCPCRRDLVSFHSYIPLPISYPVVPLMGHIYGLDPSNAKLLAPCLSKTMDQCLHHVFPCCFLNIGHRIIPRIFEDWPSTMFPYTPSYAAARMGIVHLSRKIYLSYNLRCRVICICTFDDHAVTMVPGRINNR